MAAFSARDLTDPPPRVPEDSNPRHNPYSDRLAALAEHMAGHAAEPGFPRPVLEGIVRLIEFAIVVVCGFVSYSVVAATAHGYAWLYLAAIPAMAAVAVVTFQGLSLYRIVAFRMLRFSMVRLAACWTLINAAVWGASRVLQPDAGLLRVWLLSWCAGSLCAMAIERVVLRSAVRKLCEAGRLDRRTVVVGGGPAAEELLRDLAGQSDADLQICGFFDDRTGERSPDVVAGYPKLGNVNDLVAFARYTRIDLIIFAMPITAEQRLLDMLRKLWVLPIDIRLAAHTNKLRFRPRSYSYVGTVPMIDVFDKPIADWDIVLKAIFDKLVGSLCLLSLSPLMALIALAVKLDSKGPVFFRQQRLGFNNEIIEVFKFRSMYVDQLDYNVTKQVTRGDPRVTRVGRFIRRTSLDELPQLLNVVLKGNLSLVGPRPHALNARAAEKHYDEIVDSYFARHRVRPGITGWAQIHGWRGETDTPEKIQGRVDCDLYYIENWSILLDLYVLLATPLALLKGENAY